MMPRIDQKKIDLREFAEFVDAESVSPRNEIDEAIYRMVGRKVKPITWLLLARMLFIQISTGILTLAVCPQFGVGTSTNNAFIHSLHSFDNPFLYYLSCGIIFVLLGAVVNGLTMGRQDIDSLHKGRFAAFTIYGICACGVFTVLGAEVLLLGAVFWIVGSVLGNVIGFEMGTRLRQAVA